MKKNVIAIGLFCLAVTMLSAAPAVATRSELRENSRGQKLVQGVLEICAAAAELQYRGLAGNEIVAFNGTTIGGSNFAAAERLYYVAVDTCGQIEQAAGNDPGTRRVLSKVYAQIGWFLEKTGRSTALGTPSQSLIDRAVQLDSSNVVALYMKTKLSEKAMTPEVLLAAYKGIVAVDSDFTEAWLEVAKLYARLQKINENEQALSRFVATQSHFKPELWFFDTSFPPERLTIHIGQTELLARRKFADSNTRFRIPAQEN
jgi:hypothetical protein